MRLRSKALAFIAGLALLLTPVADVAGKAAPLKFMSGNAPTGVGGLHPTSGLAGFDSRDYMAPGGTLVRAPFSGCVPENRPWGWLSYQNPAAGFGGARIYLLQTKTGRTAYLAHFGDPKYGDIFLKPGQCFKQGQPVGYVWRWPNDPGRSHIHMGWTGGDPLVKLVDRAGNFLIQEQPTWEPGKKRFPRVYLRYEGNKWRVYVGTKKLVYQGGEKKARVVYSRQKLARTLNLHFRSVSADSPLIGFGLMMVREFRARNVDPRLPAAIATCETQAGTTGNGPKINNDFGLMRWDKNMKRHVLRKFKNRKAAFRYLGDLLSGPKYAGAGLDTIKEIGARYAPVGAANDPRNKNVNWVPCVTKNYKKVNGTRYL